MLLPDWYLSPVKKMSSRVSIKFKIITVLGCNVTRKLEYPAHYKSVFCAALILEHASSFSLKGKHLFLVYAKRILHSFIIHGISAHGSQRMVTLKRAA
jgi:hypothetical protein